MKLLGIGLLTPLILGSFAVHILASDPEEAAKLQRAVGQGEADDPEAIEYSRTALSWTLHYAGALLSVSAAVHWGMQLAEFGVPRRSEHMALYYLSRFSAPVVFVFFGWLGSVLSTAEPGEASMWLLMGYAGMISYDFMITMFYMAPPWWFRWRAGLSIAAILCLVLTQFSERNLYLGQKPMIRM